MPDSRFALSNQTKNTLKATQTWLNVWRTLTTERNLTHNWNNKSMNGPFHLAIIDFNV